MSDIVERRMDAYYYSFVPTGVAAVDKVLGAVACAGKAYHHTDDWCVDTPAYDDHTGPTPVDWIQNAAFEVAAEITALRAENERLREECAKARKTSQYWKDNRIAGNSEIERLRAALRPFASIKADHGDDFSKLPDTVIIRCEASVRELKAARAALERSDD